MNEDGSCTNENPSRRVLEDVRVEMWDCHCGFLWNISMTVDSLNPEEVWNESTKLLLWQKHNGQERQVISKHC